MLSDPNRRYTVGLEVPASSENERLNEPPCLSVVMPCFNEATTIQEVIARVLRSPYVGELIVVDDGSTDGSADVLRTITDPRVRLIVQPVNMGKGAALRRGFSAARMEYVLVQDADLEYDPREYKTLLGPLLDGRADVVYGSRFHNSRPHRVLYYWHSVGNAVLTLASNMVTNLNLSDMETCYKAFRREVIQGISIDEDRFGFEPEITAKVAAGGWRIYEVGISYSGRTYAEGKKIGWKDGVRAMYCIVRYGVGTQHSERRKRRPVPAPIAEADTNLRDTLESLDGADNYVAWIMDKLRPHLSGRILELGAGHGTLTEHLSTCGAVVASEISERCIAGLRQRFSGRPGVSIVAGDVIQDESVRGFDTVVLVNVLEHIEKDEQALAKLADKLKPGGKLLIFVPASEALYSKYDARIGHHRRYSRGELMGTVYRSGLEVVEARYVNAPGAVAWWLTAKTLGMTPTRPLAVKLYDTLVIPWARQLEDWRPPSFGQSLFLLARKLPSP